MFLAWGVVSTPGEGIVMTASAARVAARRNVMDAHSQRRRLRQEREDRLAALAVQVNVALATGQAAMQKAERTAGQALDKMLEMGASIAEVVEWCAGDLTAKDIARLRQATAAQQKADADGAPTTAPPATSDKDDLAPSRHSS